MAITAIFSAGAGVLSVLGDGLDNSVTISRDVAGNLRVNGGAVPITGGGATVANTSLIQVFGKGGNDTITGGSANDFLNGGSGNNTVNGGGGVKVGSRVAVGWKLNAAASVRSMVAVTSGVGVDGASTTNNSPPVTVT